MVKISTVAMALLVAVATARPNSLHTIPESETSTANNTVSKRGDKPKTFGFYECSDEGFRGQCHWTEIKKGQSICYNRLFNQRGGSFGPDKGVVCKLYSMPFCEEKRGRLDGFRWPGQMTDCSKDPVMKKAGIKLCPYSWRCDVE